MSYKCEILADSLSPNNNRLTTFKVTYPRIIHAEMLRHRMFSRNVASSRAIPFNKMVKDVEENPFIPIAWQKAHKGMQGSEYFDYEMVQELKWDWLKARDNAIRLAKTLNIKEATKQLCNRLLEPFVWTTELITTSEEGLQNFFELRCPQYGNKEHGFYKSKKDALRYIKEKGADITKLLNSTNLEWLQINQSEAEIHIQAIAEMMWDAYNESEPKDLKVGEWHTPFGDRIKFNSGSLIGSELWDDNKETFLDFVIRQAIKVATARCARISYETLGDNPKIDYEADIRLHDRLIKDKHWSPFEHCARVMSDEEYYTSYRGPIQVEFDNENINQDWCQLETQYCGWSRNFRGFIQYRHLIENK
jgi:thymidylate synthase ThyX